MVRPDVEERGSPHDEDGQGEQDAKRAGDPDRSEPHPQGSRDRDGDHRAERHRDGRHAEPEKASTLSDVVGDVEGSDQPGKAT